MLSVVNKSVMRAVVGLSLSVAVVLGQSGDGSGNGLPAGSEDILSRWVPVLGL